LVDFEWVEVLPLIVVHTVMEVQGARGLFGEFNRQLGRNVLDAGQKLVSQDLRQLNSFARIFMKTFIYQVPGILRNHSVFREIVLYHTYSGVHIFLVLSIKGQLPDQKHVDADAKRPDVHLKAMPVIRIFFQNLWCQVVWSAQ
jgi:hypothetical protein